MTGKRLLIVLAAALPAIFTGCDRFGQQEPPDPAVEQSCREEGFDPGTTEFADCVEELSESD